MFLTRPRADTSGDMNDRSAYGGFWFNPISRSGTQVSPESSMRVSAVYASVKVLAETFACLPFCLRKKGTRSNGKKITDHWLYRLFSIRPNAWQTPFEWREMLEGHLALRGNCYNRIYSNSKGEITDLIPVHPDRVKVKYLEGGDYGYTITGKGGGFLTRSELWHVRGLSADGIMGMSPIEVARDTVSVGLSAQQYAARFFNNDATPSGGWIEHPGNFADKTKRQQFREDWQKEQGGKNRGKAAILEYGMKYHQIQINNKDSQFLETRQFTIADIARIFRIPPHLIGDLTKSTNNNIEQQSLEFVLYTMVPWAERWESSIEFFLSVDDDLEVEFDFNRLLRGDSAARATFYHWGITDGWLLRNEAREMEGMESVDGLDVPLRPANMVSGDSEDPTPAGPSPATATVTPTDQETDQETDTETEGRRIQKQRMARLLCAGASRLATRAVKSLAKGTSGQVFDAAYAMAVKEIMAIPFEKAEACCAELATIASMPDEPDREMAFTRTLIKYGELSC